MMRNKIFVTLMFLSLLCINSFVSACQESKKDEITDMLVVCKRKVIMQEREQYLALNKEKYEQLGLDVSDSDNSSLVMLESATCIYNSTKIDLITKGLHVSGDIPTSSFQYPSSMQLLTVIDFPKIWPENLLTQLKEKGATINGICYRPRIVPSSDMCPIGKNYAEMKQNSKDKKELLGFLSNVDKAIDQGNEELSDAEERLNKRKELNKQEARFFFRAKVCVVGLTVVALLAVMCWFNKDHWQGYFGK